MKKIFVTVQEFESNGGKLTIGRKIYTSIDGQFHGELYDGESNHGAEYFKSHNSDWPQKKDNNYIQIDCTPIYV